MVDAWQSQRFFEGLARALLAVRRPMLLVLDNVQWCDQETLAFIAFFLGLAPEFPGHGRRHATRRRPRRGPGSAGVDGPDAGDRSAHRDRPQPAGAGRHCTGSPTAIGGPSLEAPDAELMQAMTGGFPLYVIEAVRAMAGPGSAAAARRGPRRRAAQPAGAGIADGPRDRRARVGRRSRFQPGSADRGQRPRGRRCRPRGRRAVGPPDPARAARRLRLLARPAPRDARTSR